MDLMKVSNKMKNMIYIVVLLIVLTTSAICENINIIGLTNTFESDMILKEIDEEELIEMKVDTLEGYSTACFNIPSNASFNEDVFRWRPSKDQSGAYDIVFKAYDPNMPSTAFFKTIRVIVHNTIRDVIIGTHFEEMFSSIDNEGDKVEIILESALPEGASFIGAQFEPKLFSWTPSVSQIGEYELIIKTKDYPDDVSYPEENTQTIILNVYDPSEDFSKFDFNEDGQVNAIDFSMFSAHWLQGNVVQPEPKIFPNKIQENFKLEELVNIISDFWMSE